ncbi:MAG: hypothetical protein KDA21_14460, partial [Phycisphaerales bacterium]|nr:hypothetical protein [Phycisphaerales bacterium]
VPAGYISNFNIPHLVIGPGARVNLFDAVNNGNRGGPGGNTEALYVGTLEFLDGAGLVNLNGHHLYYSNLVGNPAQIIDNGGGSGKGFTPTWTCAGGAWTTTGCWNGLPPGTLFPDNGDFTACDVILPNNGTYTLMVDSSAPGVELTSLSIDTNVTLRLLSSDFSPGLLLNSGTLQVASDELVLSQSIVNDGMIEFDLDTAPESVSLLRSLQITGTGTIRFPDIASSAPQHALVAPNGGTLTLGSGQFVHGGPGRIGGGSSLTTNVIVNGEVRADTPGKILEFSDETSANELVVTNNGIIAATGGGTLAFDDIADVVNLGTISCDSTSTILITSTTTTLGGTLAIDGRLECDSALTLSGAVGSGSGTLFTTGALTCTGASMVGFGILDHNTSAISVSGGSTLIIEQAWTHTLSSESAFDFALGSTLMVTGGTAAGPGDYEDFASIEIAGHDEGDVAGGYTNNFDLPHLVIGPGARVNLFDAVDNGNRGGPGGNGEALYVNTLEFADGAGLLNLNGHHLYYGSLVGSPTQIIDNGGGSGKGFSPTWTCGTGTWSTTGCWSGLAPGDLFPQRTDFT